MYVKVGSYQHPVHEVTLRRFEVRNRLSPRHKRLSRIHTIHLEGELQYTSQSEITAAINEFLLAYRDDYQEIGLYQDDGTPTTHRLTNAASVSGVKILRHAWPRGDGDEYAVCRNFTLEAYSEVQDDETPLVYWTDKVRTIGTGGPRVVVEDFFNGPRPAVTCLATKRRVIRSGKAVGFRSYVDFPGPLSGMIEHVDMRVEERVSGQNQGLLACYYTTEWTYYHTGIGSAGIGSEPQTR